MKYTRSQPKIKVIVVAFLLVIVLNLAVFLAIGDRRPDDVESLYNRYISLNKPLAKSIMDDLYEITDSVGVDGAVRLVKKGVAASKIKSSECHGIMHLLGHELYTRPSEIEANLKNYADMCEAGLLHGLESQIALQETDIATRNKELQKVCTFFTSNYQNVACFHGVGHSYYQIFNDPLKALKACDTLKSEETDPNPCYRGVFNEIASEMHGIDGETGLAIPEGSRKLKMVEDPLRYCHSFEEKYHIHCYSSILQLHKIAIPKPDFADKLSGDQKKIINTQLPKVTAKEKEDHEQAVRNHAKKADFLELGDCKPVTPLVMKVKKGESILVKNSTSEIRTIMLNKDASFAVKPHSSISIDYDFGQGQSIIYGYGCDYTPYAVGYFLIEESF